MLLQSTRCGGYFKGGIGGAQRLLPVIATIIIIPLGLGSCKQFLGCFTAHQLNTRALVVEMARHWRRGEYYDREQLYQIPEGAWTKTDVPLVDRPHLHLIVSGRRFDTQPFEYNGRRVRFDEELTVDREGDYPFPDPSDHRSSMQYRK